MTTSLYLVTISTWFLFKVFTGPDQTDQCTTLLKDLEKRYEVNAVCLTKNNKTIVVTQ
tara:strand:- start:9108 stop:9281 length:174 start_codon:yes stop_codon:yes gene_type:complete